VLHAAQEETVPVFFLAASFAPSSPSSVAENSHLGHGLPTAVLHLGFAAVISNTATGFGGCLYDFGRRSRSTLVNGVSPGTAGTALECRDYLPFGEILTAGRNNSCASSDRGVAELFTGKERDAETGLDNFLARYFSSAQGRFMSPDPIGNFIADAANPQSWNMYSYVRNNPLANVDPTGMTCVTVSHPDETTNQADNGDGQGCSGAGVSQSKLRNDLKGTPLVNNSDIKPQDFEFVYGGSGSATFASAALLGQFLTGTGHDNRIYDKQTVETQNLLKSGGIKQISNRIEQACASGQTMNPLDSNGLPPELSTPEAAKSLPYDALHSPVGVQVGGYRYTWQAANSGVDVQINNVAGANSFFYHGPKDRPATGVGPFRSINQRFDFNLPIKCGN
jgi:RHS repeat-associated protein